ncbi:MAG: hypothetical protein ABJB32_07065, partial [Verrucomicrobiota bacterium]
NLHRLKAKERQPREVQIEPKIFCDLLNGTNTVELRGKLPALSRVNAGRDCMTIIRADGGAAATERG